MVISQTYVPQYISSELLWPALAAKAGRGQQPYHQPLPALTGSGRPLPGQAGNGWSGRQQPIKAGNGQSGPAITISFRPLPAHRPLSAQPASLPFSGPCQPSQPHYLLPSPAGLTGLCRPSQTHSGPCRPSWLFGCYHGNPAGSCWPCWLLPAPAGQRSSLDRTGGRRIKVSKIMVVHI